MTVSETVGTVAKAVAGAATAGGAALVAALSDGTVTPGEWVTVAVALVTGAGLVYAVPNAPASEQ